MRRDVLETMVCRWLFRTFDRKVKSACGRPKLHKFKLLHRILMDMPEIQLILSKECPYCRRRFRRRATLYAHLTPYGSERIDCKVQFSLLLNYIADTYRKMRSLIRRHNGRYYVKGCLGYFRTFEEAYLKAKEVLSQSSRPTS